MLMKRLPYGTVTTLLNAGPAQKHHSTIPDVRQRLIDKPSRMPQFAVLETMTIPKTWPWCKNYKDEEYYNDKIKEVNHKVNMCRKLFRRQRTLGNVALQREGSRKITSCSAPRCGHHDLQSEADRLVKFSVRTKSNSLPAELRTNI